MFIRKSTPEDFAMFVPAHHDILEAQALGIKPEVPEGTECVTLDLNGFPLAIGGNEGDQVWFITSDQVWRLDTSHKRQFYKAICQYRDQMLAQYESLWNYVWTGNKPHIKFLQSIGAEFGHMTRNGEFQMFVINRR